MTEILPASPWHHLGCSCHGRPTLAGLYNDFSRIATDLNVYTGVDYADIIEHLNDFWGIEQAQKSR